MRFKFLFFIVGIFFLLIFPNNTFAEEIRSFDVVVQADRDGILEVEEEINYDFENLEKHGIFRDIPLVSKVGNLYRVIKIRNVRVTRNNSEEKFEINKDANKLNIKIGDPNKTITGNHVYKINYEVENGIGSNYETHDEIYWNATGNDWEVPIDKASITFKTPNDIKQRDLICFTGSEGSTEKNCENEESKVVSKEILYPGMGLTAAAKYDKGAFPRSILQSEPPASFGQKILSFLLRYIYVFWLILNLIIPLALMIWYNKRKNKKRFGKPTVNFEIPKDQNGNIIPPALAGTIDTAKLERDDCVATLFDLAIRRYIRLEETKTKRQLLPDLVQQKIVKCKQKDEKLNIFEQKLFDRLFKDGEEIFAKDLKKDFYKTYEDLEQIAFKELVHKKYFVRNPKIQRGLILALGIVALFTANIILSGMLIFLSIKLIGRTTLGDEIDFKIDGLKLFLKSMDRNYKWQAKKFYTVEQMIPYAMSLGYIDKFMEQLKIINPDYNPTWYRGYSGSFYGAYAGFYTSVNSNLTTSAPSSSSGFSGGSSGGGGGGGGGGSW